jgi:SAM-dependent methyltransferase
MKNYDQQFFADRDDRTRYAAQRVLDIALGLLPPINSCIDIGCGVGTWLRVLADRGFEDILGAEGDWLDTSLLMIDPDRFMRIDLRRPIEIDRRFDMAISLEVAEHITPEEGDRLVSKLTQIADFVLFSAAVPCQGGKHHINEQWQTYWARRFGAADFVPIDAIRPRIWDDDRVAVWYRQNTILYVRKSRLGDLNPAATPAEPGTLSMVHPELYTRRLLRAHSLSGGVKSALRSLTGGGRAVRTLRQAEPPTE